MSHDELAKADWKDHDRIKRMAITYSARYDDSFWRAIKKLTGSTPRRIVADFGCGPGLFLLDAAKVYAAEKIVGLDESSGMLEYARGSITKRSPRQSFELIDINFDNTRIHIAPETIELAFCGFMLHEVRDPQDFVNQVAQTIASAGLYVAYDYISGNEAAFVKAMIKVGIDEDHAHERYPHMCKHSIDDIIALMKNAGLKEIRAVSINDMRAVVVGKK
jgi:ubiquinone/menaquinone biosynthesis C-methylase UbiE